ncbi:MAG: hypothetical protein R3F11_01520 [Verrucomicrobiales bacterium]
MKPLPFLAAAASAASLALAAFAFAEDAPAPDSAKNAKPARRRRSQAGRGRGDDHRRHAGDARQKMDLLGGGARFLVPADPNGRSWTIRWTAGPA